MTDGPLLADGGTYQLYRATTADDASGFPVTQIPADPSWSGGGYSNQRPDRSFTVTLDVSAWPVSYGDRVVLPDGTHVVVRTTNLNPSDPDPTFDPVRAVDLTGVLADLEQLPREEQGAEPG